MIRFIFLCKIEAHIDFCVQLRNKWQKMSFEGSLGPQSRVKNSIFYDLFHKSSGNEVSKNDKYYHFCYDWKVVPGPIRSGRFSYAMKWGKVSPLIDNHRERCHHRDPCTRPLVSRALAHKMHFSQQSRFFIKNGCVMLRLKTNITSSP